MSNVKKIYQPLINLLEDNKNKKISTIMPEILKIVQSKQATTSFKVNDEGIVTHAQYEIRVYAEAMLKLIEPICPVAVAAFKKKNDY